MGRKKTPWAAEAPKADPNAIFNFLVKEILSDPVKREAARKQINGELAKISFAHFVKEAWHVVEPSTVLDWNWHHQLICDTMQAMFHAWRDARTQKGKRVNIFQGMPKNALINCPPGSLKSRIISVCYPVWCWVHEPGMRFICLSVNEDAAMRDGRMSRELIRSDWYQSTFKPTWTLNTDQTAVSNYGNSVSGERLSRASGSEIVGLRGDCLILDDPNNPKEAENKLEREKINDQYQSNIHTRVNDPRCSMRICVQQRVHNDDFSGFILRVHGSWSLTSEFGWLHIVLPAEYEPERKYIMPDCLAKYCTWPGAVTKDPRELEGESIHRARFNESYLKAEKERWKYTGHYAGQMQQRPAMMEGTLVKRSWWGWFRLAEGVRDDIAANGHNPRPAMCHSGEPLTIHRKPYTEDQWDFDWITISVDPAAKKTEKGSQYGLLCIAGKGGRRFILDDRTQRGAFHEILDIIKDMIMTWRPDSILIEPKAAGPDLMDTLREQMYAGDVPMVSIEEADPGNTDKESRLQATIPALRNGAVLLLDGASWTPEFVEELSMFPNASNDDRVDAFSQCMNNKRPVDDEMPDW